MRSVRIRIYNNGICIFLGRTYTLLGPKLQRGKDIKGSFKYFYKGKNISEILDMTIKEAYYFFKSEEKISKALKLLVDVGLDYLKLGQPLSTLSGGENQRLKLASKLNRKGNIFILDEPTKGLHFQDIDYLLKLIQKLIKNGNTMIVVEHNIELIKNSDWIIELGYGAGKKGGKVIFEGKVGDISKIKVLL